MRSFHVVRVALIAVLGACASPADDAGDNAQIQVMPVGVDPQGELAPGPRGAPEPGEGPMLGVHHARNAGTSGTTAPGNMTPHGGAVMTSSAVTTIFWGKSWASASFAGDKIAGLNRLYAGLASAISYVASNTEYSGTNGQVGHAVTYAGTKLDTSAAPATAPRTSAILAEVCKVITRPVANGYYPVYSDAKRGGAGYCAWHSYGTCAGVPVQFAFFFNLDGDTGCDPQDTGHAHSQGLTALANVSGHEWSETVTDPRNGGWWDAAGNENGDKCAWSFPSTRTVTSVVNPLTGQPDSWKIQGNWSNAAFLAGSGYPNRSGQNGCSPK